MNEVAGEETEAIDLAVAVFREGSQWRVESLADTALDDVDAIVAALRRFPGPEGALALVSIDEDFVVLVRAQSDLVRILLSDASTATEWKLARSAMDRLRLPIDDDEQVPAGDLGIVADLGLSARQMGVLMDDYDLYPEEVLSEIAAAIGCGEEFDAVAGLPDE